MNSSDDVDTLFAALSSLPEDATARVPLLIEVLSGDGREFHEHIVSKLDLSEGRVLRLLGVEEVPTDCIES